MMKKIGKIHFSFLLFLGGSTLIFASELSFTSEVNKTRVSLGEELIFTVTVSGNYSKMPRVKFPVFSDFMVISSKQSSRYRLKQKEAQVISKYEFTLLPKKEGLLLIGQAEIEYRDKVYKTQPITIEVSSSTPIPHKKEKTPFKKKGVIL